MAPCNRHKSEPQSDTSLALQTIVRLIARQAARTAFATAHTPDASCRAKISGGDGANG